MTVRLTDQNIRDLLEQAEQQGEHIFHTTDFGSQRKIPKGIGAGDIQYLNLRGGLTIGINNGQFWQPIIHKRQHGETFPITAKFCLSGDIRVKTDHVPGLATDYAEVAGDNYLYHLPDLTEFEEHPSDTPLQVVTIYADIDYFRAINPANDELPHPLQRLINTNKRFHQPLGKTTLAMTQVIQQILHCPYQGDTQQLYLESKALELLALQFASLEADANAPKYSPLKATDLERVQYARDILTERFDHPPSLTELSHQVGLSDRKLRQGFRHLFGKTVFGYLYEYRMEQAKSLLRESYTTIAEVATQVGYRNPEAFSTAFRRQFSVSPKTYQLQQCGQKV
ncbi:MAG: AraC family transcriptional regulator [Cyanobacteria bacterium P01_B01_bin.77]